MDFLTQASFAPKKLTQDELNHLFQLCADGDTEARDRIVTAYIPFVIKVCKRYQGRGVAEDDLFQEGVYGLLIALNKFDFKRGTSFASYALPFVEKYIKKAMISQNLFQPIVYEEDFFYRMQRYISALDELSVQLNREPTNKELAERLHTTENKIRILSQSLYSFFPFQDLTILAGQGQRLPFTPLPSAEDAVLEHVLDVSFLHVSLTKREKEVLARRLGFTDSGVPEDIVSISAAMNLSSQTIRNVYNQAIEKLRAAAKENDYTVSTIQI